MRIDYTQEEAAQAATVEIADDDARARRWADYGAALVTAQRLRERMLERSSMDRTDLARKAWAGVAMLIGEVQRFGEMASTDALVLPTVDLAETDGWPDVWRCFARTMEQEMGR